MAEDESAEVSLLEAIERVNNMPWPLTRHRALWKALVIIARHLYLDIVKIEQPVALGGADPSKPPALEKDNGKE